MKHQDFQSNRLNMQLVEARLAPMIWSLLSDPSLYTFVPQDPPTLENLEKRYLFWENRLSPDKTEYWLNWVIFEKDSNSPIGTLQAGVHIESQVATIAYKVGTSYQRKGYGTESVIAMIEHLRTDYGVTQIKAWIDTRNVPSISLVEKIGMKQIQYIEKADHFKGSDSHEYVYQMDIADTRHSS